MSEDSIGGSGYTLADLSHYLDRGRTPAIPEIDNDPQCQSVLASLERIGSLSRELVAAEAADIDERWFDSVMREVTREVRSGRDIPLTRRPADSHLVVTEGAIRGLVRELGDALPGVIVERTRFVGDVTDIESDARVEIAVSVTIGRPLQDAAENVRRTVVEALARHTGLHISAVDVTVDSLHAPGAAGEAS